MTLMYHDVSFFKSLSVKYLYKYNYFLFLSRIRHDQFSRLDESVV